MPSAPRKRLCRAVLVLAGAGYLAFLLLFELPSLPFSPPSSSSSLPTHHSQRRELEASASTSLFSPARPSNPAIPSAASPAPSPPPLSIFSSLLVLPRSNATTTPFDGTAADAFSAAKPHLSHLRTAAPSASTASPPPFSPTCPASISLDADRLPSDGVRTVELPCGLSVGSHVTVVARPRAARPEYDPKIAERKDGKTPLMVSQFMVELVGTKVVDGEAPPRILHFNPRIRGDYSGKPVIEMNSCYRMQWGRSQRCEGYASRPAEETVDAQLKCEKWIRDDCNKSEESKMKWWVKRLIGRSKDVHISWPYPFAEDKLFVLTLTAGLEGYHVNVDGRHVTSFPYRTGYTLEDATGLSLNGDIDIESIFASTLPSSHPSFSPERYLEMSEQWRAPPLPTEPVELFIGILSAANHFAERMAVRKSWMMYTRKSSNIVARFFVALNGKKQINAELKKEAEFFRDIVIVPFMDSYDLVVLKTIAIAEYGVRVIPAKYVMKCDDDTFVRIDSVLEQVKKIRSDKSVYVGSMNYYHRPLRSGKWAVTYEVALVILYLTMLLAGMEGSFVKQIIREDWEAPHHLRTPTTVMVRESHVDRMGSIQDVAYEILNVLEFNSTRKRQSVVCRFPNGKLVLYCKGADNVIYERLADGNHDIKKKSREHLEQFGSAGLRTLCLAYRDLSRDQYESWNEKFMQAKSSLRDRDKKLDEVAELIEKDLILIGCTAIEDKLQEGVPACIETLSSAGIKIWMLTGDKMETAINIAYACSLVNNDTKQFIISSETNAIREAEDRGDPVEIARVIKDSVKQSLRSYLEEAHRSLSSTPGRKLAFIIDGRCLMYALDPALRVNLLGLSLICHSVVCCRVSPLQKAQVTSLVRKGARKITLSIGDGANDVSMIQAAHVGIGISGQEGMQAVMASDFAIAQFRYLTDLLLVHGRWSYLRLCKVITYFFYKNLTFTLTQFWFTFQTGFSGQRFYDDWFQSLYNVIFTALPVIMVGLFDKDVSASLSKKYPQLYQEGIRNTFFKWKVIAVWAFFAFYQSIVFYYFTAAASQHGHGSSGKILGQWDVSTMAFTCVVVTVNLRLLMSCNSITRWHYFSVAGSIAAWFLFIFIYSAIMTSFDRQENVYFVIYVLMSTFFFYLTLMLVPVIALFGDFLYLSLQRWLFPYDYQVVQEMHKDDPHEYSMIHLPERSHLSPEEARSYAISMLPRENSKHTGFAFDSPGYESFFASQQGVCVPHKPWDVARRASMKQQRQQPQRTGRS